MSALRDKLLAIATAPGSGGASGAFLRAAASVAAVAYGTVLAGRNRLYDCGLLASYDLGRRVVSIGNLSAGGTGKTPMVAYVARNLAALGCKPAVLLRGYKSVAGVSDEQMELAELLPGVRVEAGSDRVASAGRVLAAGPSVGAFVLDDAFQHRRVRRDLNIVLVSATQGLSGGHVLPRGLLRERPSGLKRADLLVITRADQVSAEKLQALREEIRRHGPTAPLVTCMHSPTEVACVHGAGRPEDLREGVFALAGTGDPQAFERTVADLGAKVVARRWFSDHHPYCLADVAAAMGEAGAMGARAIVTTGKDWTKLARIASAFELPVFVVRVEVRFAEGDDAVVKAIIRERVLEHAVD